MKKIQQKIVDKKNKGKKSFAVLIDPDKVTDFDHIADLVSLGNKHNIDYFFVGGSLITNNMLNPTIKVIKELSDIPAILFPGSYMHIDPSADGILLLSLISGRNPDLLIGQHVSAAPILKNSDLEIISTGYIIVGSGVETTVAYISNTNPIPYDKDILAATTAMAGEMLGLQMIYLDAGSGAHEPVRPKMIRTVRESVDVPLIVGGGIRSVEAAVKTLEAGADIIVVGNGIEKDPKLLPEIAEGIAAIVSH